MRRPVTLVATLVLALGAAAPASAQPVPSGNVGAPVPGSASYAATWTRSTSGPPLIWDAVAFAGSTCRLVTFGGTDGYVMPRATNLFDPASGKWTAVSAPRKGSWPTWRAHARMAWDPVRKRVVMFGGRSLSGALLQDTWAFDPAARTWTPLITSCRKGIACPPARWGHGMVWSSAIGRVVLFGGDGGDDRGLNDVWTFDGETWQRLSTNDGPSGRYLLGMAEDANSGRIVVYGGAALYSTPGGNVLGPVPDATTWLLDAKTGTWTRVATPTVSEPRAELGMAWAPSVGAVVAANGDAASTASSWTNSAWAYDTSARDWRPVAVGSALPTARNSATLTANSCDGSAILNGGTGTNRLPIDLEDRTWILH